MNDSEKRVTIFALTSLKDSLSSRIIDYMIGEGIPGVHENDINGVADIISGAILAVEGCYFGS